MNDNVAGKTDDAVAGFASDRSIREILHFTTNKGLLGIFATGAVLSRKRLDRHQFVEYIYTPNCENRLKDEGWIDYVNLSISRVNGHMLGVSENWHSHQNVWWAVLAFDVEILAHPGVYFTTTNNTYTFCVKRGERVDALRRLFAESVEWGWYGSRKTRYPGMPDEWTTDPQAEVLYPAQLSLEFLRSIYVREEERIDDVNGLFGVFPSLQRVPVTLRPEVFQ